MSKLPPEPKPSDPSFKKLDVDTVVKQSVARKLMNRRINKENDNDQ